MWHQSFLPTAFSFLEAPCSVFLYRACSSVFVPCSLCECVEVSLDRNRPLWVLHSPPSSVVHFHCWKTVCIYMCTGVHVSVYRNSKRVQRKARTSYLHTFDGYVTIKCQNMLRHCGGKYIHIHNLQNIKSMLTCCLVNLQLYLRFLFFNRMGSGLGSFNFSPFIVPMHVQSIHRPLDEILL